jgi:hypothetical protein
MASQTGLGKDLGPLVGDLLPAGHPAGVVGQWKTLRGWGTGNWARFNGL